MTAEFWLLLCASDLAPVNPLSTCMYVDVHVLDLPDCTPMTAYPMYQMKLKEANVFQPKENTVGRTKGQWPLRNILHTFSLHTFDLDLFGFPYETRASKGTTTGRDPGDPGDVGDERPGKVSRTRRVHQRDADAWDLATVYLMSIETLDRLSQFASMSTRNIYTPDKDGYLEYVAEGVLAFEYRIVAGNEDHAFLLGAHTGTYSSPSAFCLLPLTFSLHLTFL